MAVSMILTADQVWAGRGRTIADAGVRVVDNRIAALGPRGELLAGAPGDPHLHLTGCCLLPGLINAHCHLELSALAAHRSAAPDFIDWLLAMIRNKGRLDAITATTAAEAAIATLPALGTTGVGDIDSIGVAVAPLVASGLRARIDVEVLGRDPARAQAMVQRLTEEWQRVQRLAGPLVNMGLSPHSPYTVGEELWRRLARWRQRHAAPLTMHAAESAAEVVFLKAGKGPLRERLLPAVGWDRLPPLGGEATAVSILADHDLLTGTHLIHAVHLQDEEIVQVARAGCTLTHCPRSNAYVGQPRAPVGRWLAAGIPVGLGTDSLASNLSLDLWEEMRFAYLWHRSGPEPIAAEEILHMATAGSARALGWQDVTGTLAPGKAADVVAVTLPAGPVATLPERLLCDGHATGVRLTLVAGQPLWHAPDVDPSIWS
jgi:cytosine/adenosine deaminase-related metal-dependent hydrolase